MPYISKTKTIPFSHKELFDLVMDVESYPDFLPFCSEAKITSKTEVQIEADLKIAFAGVSESYSSLIIPTFQEDYAAIDVKATRGPFKHLTNLWKFIPINESTTRVEFMLNFELKSFLLSKIIDVFLNEMHHKILDAFEKRAREKYGAKNLPK